MTTKKIKVIKKGTNVEETQKRDEKSVKTTEIALKVSDWIEDFYRKKSENERSLAMFVGEKN